MEEEARREPGNPKLSGKLPLNGGGSGGSTSSGRLLNRKASRRDFLIEYFLSMRP